MNKILTVLLISAASLFAQPPQREPINITSIEASGIDAITIQWRGGIPPYKLQATYDSASRSWRDASFHVYARKITIPKFPEGSVFFRVRSIPDAMAPPALKNFRARLFSPGYVMLEWDAQLPDAAGGTGLRGVRLFRNGAPLMEVLAPAPQYVDVTAQQGEVYDYTAVAIDEALNQSAMSGVRVEVPDYTVTLAWDANPESDIAGYQLHWGFSTGQYVDCFDVGNILTYVFTLVELYETYYFAVRAYDLDGLYGPYSNEVTYRLSNGNGTNP